MFRPPLTTLQKMSSATSLQMVQAIASIYANASINSSATSSSNVTNVSVSDFAKRFSTLDTEDEDISPEVDIQGTVMTFVGTIHHGVHSSVRSSIILSVEALDVVANTNNLRRHTLGVFGHRFVLVAARYSNGMIVHIRVDFYQSGDDSVSQLVRCSRDRDALIPEQSKSVMKLASFTDIPNPPTLDSFASLLEVIYLRTLQYNVLTRNCYWYSERIVFSMAKEYAGYWKDGEVFPQELSSYMQGRTDGAHAGIAVGMPSVARRLIPRVGISPTIGVVRTAQSLIRPWLPSNQWMDSPDEEIMEIMREWETLLSARTSGDSSL